MILSYLKIAARQITRNKLFTVINVLGLAMGMSIGMLIIGMVASLLRFDQFHEKKDRIYRVISDVKDPSRSDDLKATAPLPLADKLMELPQVESTVRIRKSLSDFVVQENNEVLLNGYYTEPAFSDLFSFKYLRGNPKTALQDPFAIVLTQHAALKLFNTEDVLGKTVSFKRLGTYKVTGLVEDVPKHSHMLFEALASFSTVPILEGQSDQEAVLYSTTEHWDRFFSSYIYILLKPDAEPERVESLLAMIGDEAYPDKTKISATFSLQPLLGIVPGPNISSELGTKMIYLALVILSSLAFLILVAACFNYTNLSIAKALQRAREVGLRKISGAARGQIVWQFLMESVLISLFALMIAMAVYDIVTPHVMQNIPRATELFDFTITPGLLISFVGFALFTGIIAGILPSVALSRVNIIEALKQIKNLRLVGRVGIRNSLVVFQFTISLFLFTALAIINSQYKYSLNKDLGFKKENILVVNTSGINSDAFRNKVTELADVQSVSMSSNILGTTSVNRNLLHYHDGADSTYVSTLSTEAPYLSDLRFEFLAGENFSTSKDNKSMVIVNEQFLTLLDVNSPFDALGKTITLDRESRQVIGVVKDFNYSQLENSIEPFLFENRPEKFRYANLKLTGTNLLELRPNVEGIWKSIEPEKPFSAAFYDEHIEETYQFYINLMRIFGFVGTLAMTIAILGLLGMASYSAERRTKEIGIRKVLGANISQIMVLLSRGFITLLLVAAFIALPSAYLLFDRVILNFSAYRITIGILELGSGLLVMLVVGCTTIFSQTMKVSMADPVDALRTE